MKKNYYLGLDIGSNSVGYAVTDENYEIMKFHGEPAWGVTLFDEASLSVERRAFRTARRRLDRRQQRVQFVRELFAKEIGKVDPNFFKRLEASALYRDETDASFCIFNHLDYTDKEYYEKYPTIHHLICELMQNTEPHDVRLVYLACAWLVAHRGHFLSNIDSKNLDKIKNFDGVYKNFKKFFEDNDFTYPWSDDYKDKMGDILRKKSGITLKKNRLIELLVGAKKAPKIGTEEFPFSQEGIITLLAGGKYSLKDLFCGKEEYSDFGSVSMDMDDDKLAEVAANIGDDYALIAAIRSVYDWAVLVDVLGDATTISESKVIIYEQHKKDLKFLKHVIRKYTFPEKYDEIFRTEDKKAGSNYVAYVYHTNDGNTAELEKTNKEDFSKYILHIIREIQPDESDAEAFEDMRARLELQTFLPKQKDTDNRVIPHQLYKYELDKLLRNAETYLPSLQEKDTDGLSVSDKILSVFSFRIPYFVGPLNESSQHAWIQRRASGKIYPWNFKKLVDLDASEEEFIKRLTNTCSYLPGENVLPKDSLLYHKFTVLNEINNLKINGERISVELKQKIYNNLFLENKKVTRKKLEDFLKSEGAIHKGGTDEITGIDIDIKSNLIPQIAFKRLIDSELLTKGDAERIIERASYAKDKSRLGKWLDANYAKLPEQERKYLKSLSFKDFGRLSKKFLADFYGTEISSGTKYTIIGALWNTQCNLMELLSEKYTFVKEIEEFRKEYYAENPLTLAKRLDEMYLSNIVKRSVFRMLAIVKDITKAFGEPSKIFVETTRSGKEDQKGKRTLSRKDQILALYKDCKDEDVRELKQQLENMGDTANNKLQGDKLFLYYLQLGKSIYSGKPISLERLGTKEYDIDHIYPQSLVKDDSIINNKVLVLSEENGAKTDKYPIIKKIRNKMTGFWKHLNNLKLISDEKFKRLTRATPFSNEEKFGFINRQLTETSQSIKAITTLLKEKFKNTEIVYCKARLISEFRQEFELFKSRSFNDLHHAVDAYLNIVIGNVYHEKFTKNFFIDRPYSLKTKVLFTHQVENGGKTIWNGEKMLTRVKNIAVKNTAHFTKFAFLKKGGFFDQMPVPAADGLIPRKKDLSTRQYGGYNKPGIMFFIPVKYRVGKKSVFFILSVELLQGKHFLADQEFAKSYAKDRLQRILDKPVDDVSFPLGMTPWKINTMLSLDGFRVCISGSAGAGKSLIAQSAMQFSARKDWQFYLKKLEMLTEKMTKNPKYIYDAEYDKVTQKKNEELYDLYCEKLKNSIYSKRLNNPLQILLDGKELFLTLSAPEQAKVLLNIHSIFGRLSGGCDLTAIGGSAHSAATHAFSTTISNWKKIYSDVRLIHSSASGLWEKQSDNLLKLL